MLTLKKTVVMALVFGSGVAVAGTMGAVCSVNNVTFPCAPAWGIALQALYLQPIYSMGSLTQSSNVTDSIVDASGSNPNLATSSVGTYNSANLNWDFGFKLEGVYRLQSRNDLNLNWYHFKNSTNKTLINGTNGVVDSYWDNIFDNINNVNFYGDVATQFKSQWDAVNLEFGHPMNIGASTALRLHGGFQYVNLHTATTNTVVANDMAVAAGVFDDYTGSANLMRYYGFGPRLGTDLRYVWHNGLSLYANGAGALLFGAYKYNTSVVGTSIFTGSSFAYAQSLSNTGVVPELEVKAGASYIYSLAQGDLIIDAGWMWVNYFNIQQMTGVSTGTFYNTETDFGVQGPYLGLKWVGNVV